MGYEALNGLREQQATAMAFFDVFFLCAVVTAVLVFLVLLMKRSVDRTGRAHFRGVRTKSPLPKVINSMNDLAKKQRIVILGGGFAGLATALCLERIFSRRRRN